MCICLCIVNMKREKYYNGSKFTRVWGKFLGEFDWNVFMTLHYYEKCNINSNRSMMTSFFNRNKENIKKMFYISEYNFDFKGIHSHSLLQVDDVDELRTNLKRLRGWCNIDVLCGNDLVRNDEGVLNVGYYVSKFIDKEIDFDLFI